MIFSLLALLVGVALAASDDTFPGNSIGKGPGETFVHLFEWSWDDIAKECEDWLGPKGFTAVQISPPSEHLDLPYWYARYQPVSYTLISRSGNETQFSSMIKRCNAVGVDIYADIVVNQMAGPYGGVGVAGTKFKDRTYPPTYLPEHFHHDAGNVKTNCGVDNYKDAYNVQYCDLEGMPDLCTGCPYVQNTIAKYLNNLYDLGVKGVRIDAAKHMNATELQQILDKVNPKLYRFVEFWPNSDEGVKAAPYLPLGQLTEYRYGVVLGSLFAGTSLLSNDLATFGEAWGLVPSKQAVIFMDNQDTQRSTATLTSEKQTVLYSLANMFMLAYPYGYPKVMSSYYFTDSAEGPPVVPVHGEGGTLHCSDGVNWVCEHRWTPIANMVNWRKSAADLPVTNFISDGNALSFCRGDQACVVINRQTQNWEVALQTSMPSGYYCDIVQSDMKDCPRVFVDSEGIARVNVQRMSALAFHTGKRPAVGLPEKSPTFANVSFAIVGGVVAVSFISSIAFLLLIAKRWRPSAVDIRPLL